MPRKREQEIVDRFPQYFPDFMGDPGKTCLAWGLAIGSGWLDRFEKLCEDIQAAEPGPEFAFTQVKEKFGGLRAYFTGGNYKVATLIDEAERDSVNICEACGSRDQVTTKGNWGVTRCASCHAARETKTQS